MLSGADGKKNAPLLLGVDAPLVPARLADGELAEPVDRVADARAAAAQLAAELVRAAGRAGERTLLRGVAAQLSTSGSVGPSGAGRSPSIFPRIRTYGCKSGSRKR